MPEYALTDDEADDHYGAEDARTHVTQPDYTQNHWGLDRLRTDQRLLAAVQLSNAFRPFRVEGNADAIGICAGRAVIDGVELDYAEEDPAVDAIADNDTTYVWLYNVGGVATIGSAIDGVGWPTYPHLRLFEIPRASGVIDWEEVTDGVIDAGGIVDHRAAAMLQVDPRYAIAIETQGDTTTPSRIHITGAKSTDYLRVRVCNSAGYTNATNATLAIAGSTTEAETAPTAGKDLILKSDGNGLFELDLTDATAETVTLRIGPAPLSPRRAAYTATLNVVHAAP